MELFELFKELTPRTYKVGGCVRDDILGLEVNDVDFVCEATEEEFRKVFPHAPLVGQDFPVFLVEGCEVALTRTERSTGDGYGAFELTGVGVPVKDDLFRRDFTINAIAENCQSMEIFDPFNGQADIEDGVLRTVFDRAFEEDPVRVLRGARFHARFKFGFDEETLRLMEAAAPKLQAVTKERIALEFEKMYKQTKTPSLFFKALLTIDALKYVFPQLDRLAYVPAGPSKYHGANTGFDHTMEVIDRAAKNGYSFKVFMGALCHDLGKGTTRADLLPHHYGHEFRSRDLAKEWLAENAFSAQVNKFVPVAAEKHMLAHLVTKMKFNKRVKHFSRIRREQWTDFVNVCDCDHPLDEATRVAIENVFEAIKTTKVEVPKGHKDPRAFVEQKIVQRLKEITNGF